MTNKINWDIDSIFAGGSQSAAFDSFLNTLEKDVTHAEEVGVPAPLNQETQSAWIETIETYYNLSAHVSQGFSFAGCLVSQDVNDEAARLLISRLGQISAQINTLWTQLAAAATEQSDEDWQALLQTDTLKQVAFNLNQKRTLARQKMPSELESLAGELATDGYHAWQQLYGTVSGFKEVEFQENGSTRKMSLGQLQNKFFSDPNRDVRQRAFAAYEEAWKELAPISAMALNYQAGFRLTLYRHRNWDSVLQEPLFNNRITRQTLDTMWDVINSKSSKLLGYFEAKAKLLGIDKLTWYDLSAPIGQTNRTYTFEEAGSFIIDNFRPINSDIADFCQMAIDKQWIEAEDRPGKRGGAYCTSLPLSKETRIFMTFDGTYSTLSTLAHELGHGYHSWAMRDLPYGAKSYTMSVAETASTFNELVVTDASLKASNNDEERLSLLNQKLDDASTFMMNIRARYEFERAFFKKRLKGQLSVDELSDIMLDAQKRAHHHALAEDGYYPLFWASKHHFYITGAPFYNFPYTFGYLFSHGVYEIAKQEGAGFQKRYTALLRDTGSMETEDLAQTHLGVDLSKPDFWESAVDSILSEVDDFVALSEKVLAS